MKHIHKLTVIMSIAHISHLPSLFGQNISLNNIQKDIKYLSSDELKGRGTGTPQEITAANYIAKSFEKFKLEPKGNNNRYLYSYSFKKSKTLKDTTEKVTVNSYNVAAYLNNDAENTVIIGAHYDHLGMGHDNILSDTTAEGKIHNGADDNASGTAGVMELARYFAQNNRKEKFNFLFICFSAEELGLHGSKKYCENPTVDFSKVNYMLNMDMIGRMNDSTKKLIIYGVGTAPDWVLLIDKIPSEFSIKKDSSGIGPSDQTSFYLKDIPVLHFFTGQHADYHKPSDDYEKINFAGEKKVLEYIIRIIEETENLPKLKFQKTRTQEGHTRRSSLKVSMGIMPDYTFEGKGVKVDGVTSGKPADAAGVKAGDMIIQLGEVKLNSFQDYMKAMSVFKKGDTATLIVLREGKEIALNVAF
ncbi:MAG: M20/M25/M40 family metallo-hydrolase [Bacteroidota bacterium]